MFLNIFILELVFVFSVMMFMMVKTHFLMSLLFLEMMSMGVYFLVILLSYTGDGGMMIIFLGMMVLEGAFGLSLMVSNSRKLGGDFIVYF
uniref:NADH dehydrogenase subunit 4L n=1 Tax=Pentidionis agamae TaxID=3091002 RepID=UPI0030032776|nr:NADH dehydrogenase subunit 4L [Pentidionis agamae]